MSRRVKDIARAVGVALGISAAAGGVGCTAGTSDFGPAFCGPLTVESPITTDPAAPALEAPHLRISCTDGCFGIDGVEVNGVDGVAFSCNGGELRAEGSKDEGQGFVNVGVPLENCASGVQVAVCPGGTTLQTEMIHNDSNKSVSASARCADKSNARITCAPLPQQSQAGDSTSQAASISNHQGQV